MYKRQDIKTFSNLTWLVLSLALIINLLACAPTDTDNPGEASTPVRTTTSQALSLNATMETDTPPENVPLIPSNTPDCLALGGTLESGAFFSEVLQVDFHYRIYLPPCYQIEEHFPVVYLLHGLSNTEDQWLRLGLVEKMNTLIGEGRMPPFIIVLPYEKPIYPPQTSLYSNALVQELIPWIDSHYATIPEKTHRGIGGLSRGAAWAVRIGFENFTLFSRVGAHSLPLFQADGSKIISWVKQEPREKLPHVFIDIGRDDQEWKQAENFANLLDQYHIPHEWYFYKDGHTETYWASHLEQYLRWYAKNW